MFGFLVGWGVFWLLLWLCLTICGLFGRNDNAVGLGAIGTGISVIFLLAVMIGKLATGI